MPGRRPARGYRVARFSTGVEVDTRGPAAARLRVATTATIPGGCLHVEDAFQRLGLLTERERGVLLLLATASPNRAIARSLGITERTVKAHVGQIVAKLAVGSRTGAAIVAYVWRYGYNYNYNCGHDGGDGPGPVSRDRLASG